MKYLVVGLLGILSSYFFAHGRLPEGRRPQSDFSLHLVGCRYHETQLAMLGAQGNPDDAPCLFAREGDVEVKNVFFDGPFGRFFSLYENNSKKLDSGAESSLPIVIYLRGGPQQAMYDLAARALAKRGNTSVLSPEYLGSGLRSLYPAEDLGPAAQEVVSLIDLLRAKYPKRKLVMVGASAGAWVALQVLKARAVPTLLDGPPLLSGAQLIDENRNPAFVTQVEFVESRFLAYTDSSFTSRKEVRVPWTKQVRAFSGSQFTTDLSDQLGKLPRDRMLCLTVRVGSEDDRIGLRSLPALKRRHPSLRVITAEGAHHGSPTEAERAKTAQAIEGWLPTGCRPR